MKTTMTKREFKIWLLQNNHTHASLSKVLGIGSSSICTYNKNECYPIMFVMALQYIEIMQGGEE